MEQSGKKNHMFFIVLISGIIIVTGISIWLGSKLASWFTSRHVQKETKQEYSLKIDENEKKLTDEEKNRKEASRIKPGYLEPIPKEIIKEKTEQQKTKVEENIKKAEPKVQEKTDENENVESKENDKENQEFIEVEKIEKGTVKEIEPKMEAKTEEPQILYHIQLGIFKNKENAQKLKEELVKIGQEVYIGEIIEGSEKYYRVQIGAFKDKERAEKLARDLRMNGYRVYISVEAK